MSNTEAQDNQKLIETAAYLAKQAHMSSDPRIHKLLDEAVAALYDKQEVVPTLLLQYQHLLEAEAAWNRRDVLQSLTEERDGQ